MKTIMLVVLTMLSFASFSEESYSYNDVKGKFAVIFNEITKQCSKHISWQSVKECQEKVEGLNISVLGSGYTVNPYTVVDTEDERFAYLTVGIQYKPIGRAPAVWLYYSYEFEKPENASQRYRYKGKEFLVDYGVLQTSMVARFSSGLAFMSKNLIEELALGQPNSPRALMLRGKANPNQPLPYDLREMEGLGLSFDKLVLMQDKFYKLNIPKSGSQHKAHQF